MGESPGSTALDHYIHDTCEAELCHCQQAGGRLARSLTGINHGQTKDDALFAARGRKFCCSLLCADGESCPWGRVIRSRPSKHLIDIVICDWIASGGPEVLRAAKPDVPLEDHWITIPRSILKRHDVTLPGERVLAHSRSWPCTCKSCPSFKRTSVRARAVRIE